MNEVLRQEKKFLIDISQYYKFSRNLQRFMLPDPHNEGDGYLIRSLYFDTPEDEDYLGKVDGVELRRKIRLRSYGPAQDFAMLEMKQKQGAMQKKRSVRLPEEEARLLCRGELSPLLTHPEPFARECYALMQMQCYRPRAVVEYRRTAFIAKENKIRVTFDHHITATESNFDIFDASLLQYPVQDPSLVVLEVKYNGFLLSYIKDMLQECGSSELSVSKYCLGRTVGKHFLF